MKQLPVDLLKSALRTTWKTLQPSIPFEGERFERAVPQLMSYLSLLMKWSPRVDLIAVSSPNEVVEAHLVDSIVGGGAALTHAGLDTVADVGSGAGLPGIPLAVAYPERRFVLIEPRDKRCQFLYEVKRTLSLKNVEVVQSRYEEAELPTGSALYLSRAVSPTNDFLATLSARAATKSFFGFLLGPGEVGLDERSAASDITRYNYTLLPSSRIRRVLIL